MHLEHCWSVALPIPELYFRNTCFTVRAMVPEITVVCALSFWDSCTGTGDLWTNDSIPRVYNCYVHITYSSRQTLWIALHQPDCHNYVASSAPVREAKRVSASIHVRQRLEFYAPRLCNFVTQWLTLRLTRLGPGLLWHNRLWAYQGT